MEIIKPTKNQVFNKLKHDGCSWLGGKGCECYSRQMKSCYETAEKDLTKIIYTAEEIEQNEKENAQARLDMEKAFADFFKQEE